MDAAWLRPRFVYRDQDGAPVLIHEPQALIPVAAIGIELDSDEIRPGPAKP
jgi:hypothetical protein